MTSSQSFADFLNARRPEDEKVLIALRFYLSEVTDDKLPRELIDEMESSSGGRRQVQAAIDQLERARGDQLRAALTFFANRWEDAGERDRITRAFDGAATKLPVIEAGLIAMITMYAMFLIATGGRRRVTRTVTRRPDGTFEEKTEEDMFGPSGPLKAIGSLFSGGAAAT